jgi:thiol peroxidase
LKDAMMANVRSDVTFKGGAVNVAGTVLKAGDSAPEFTLQSTALEDITLAKSAGKTRIIATVPSLDTGVCSEETKKFSDLANSHAGVAILVVSMDLPFAIKRWCGAEGVSNVQTLSAHRSTKFAEDYGVLLSGGVLDRLLTRAVFVVDGQGKIKHVEYLKEITEHPNYDAAFAAAGT